MVLRFLAMGRLEGTKGVPLDVGLEGVEKGLAGPGGVPATFGVWEFGVLG